MVQLSEKCFYITLIIVLAILAFLLPLIIIQTGETPPPYIYLSFENDTNSSESFDDNMNRHMKEYIDNYYKLEELNNYLDDFTKYRSNLFMFRKLGETKPSGNSINEIVLKRKKPKFMVLVVSGLQANDWDSVLTTIEIMNRFYLDTERTMKLLEDFCFHFLPLMNPDGYKFSMSLPVHANWEHNYRGPGKENKPTGRSVLYNFIRNETSTQEATVLKNLFNRNRGRVKAAFLLYTPKNIDFEEERFTIPYSYIQNGTETEEFLENLGSAIADGAQDLKFMLESEIPKGRIDDWVVNKSALPVNLQAYYRPTAPEKLRAKIQKLGYNFHFVITRILGVLRTTW